MTGTSRACLGHASTLLAVASAIVRFSCFLFPVGGRVALLFA